ncbi:MAG: type II toxin-antitoxin system VapC family toxin [Leptospirales bacterium]
MIVLDTHTWIWTINGDEKIKKSGFLQIIQKSIKDHTIFIPAISIWELAMLVSKERIKLSENTLDWIEQASSAPGMSVYPLSPEIAYESTVLPGNFHGDPADRMIVATARVLHATLLTFDKQIIKYASEGYLNIAKPKR